MSFGFQRLKDLNDNTKGYSNQGSGRVQYLHAFKFSDGYNSTMPMDWCSVYLIPQGLPKYIYPSIVTLILYHHYLKIVGNNKLWPDMQKESWNIHLMKILICSHTLNGTDS
jgi:hypothetical protein